MQKIRIRTLHSFVFQQRNLFFLNQKGNNSAKHFYFFILLSSSSIPCLFLCLYSSGSTNAMTVYLETIPLPMPPCETSCPLVIVTASQSYCLTPSTLAFCPATTPSTTSSTTSSHTNKSQKLHG